MTGYALTFCRLSSKANLPNKRTGSQEKDDIMLTIWDLEEWQNSFFSFKPPLATLKNCTLSNDKTALCLNGKDFQGRELILVYSWQDLIKYKKIELIGR